MTAGMTSGKRSGLDTVADSRGVIAALAIEQRGAMRSLFAEAMGMETASVPAEMLVTFKEAVSRILTPHASAILLDLEYGLPAAKQRAKSAGLLLAYEQTGYDKQVRGRMPRLLEGWTAQRLVEAGADSVKLLLYYSTLSSAEINEARHEFVKGVGAECAESGVPFFLELVSYGQGRDDTGAEFAEVKPEVVARSMAGIFQARIPRGCFEGRSASEHGFRGGLTRGRERNSLHPGRGNRLLSAGGRRSASAIHLPVAGSEQRNVPVRAGTGRVS
jgi:tagatose 1,6-diphosphate aldolase